MKKLAEIIYRIRWAILVSVVALTLSGVYLLRDGIRINSDVIDTLPEDDPVAVLFKQIGKDFKGSSVGLIALEADNILTKQGIADIGRITDSLKYNEQVATVTSLTNIIDIRGSKWGIEIGKLINEYELPQTDEEIASLTKRVFEKEMYKGAIVSKDTTVALMMFTIRDDADKEIAAKEIKKIVLSFDLAEKVYFAGSPFMLNDINDMVLHDIIRLIPFSFIMILLVFALSFRSVQGVILPILSAAIAIIWTIATMKLLGFELSIITNTIPILLLALGSAYSIHVLNRYNQTDDENKKQKIITSLTYIAVPVLLASLTTIVGFLSFVFGSYLTMIKEFGIFTAVGVFYSLLISLTFVPAMLAIFHREHTNKEIKPKSHQNGLMERWFLLPINQVVKLHPRTTLLVWALAILCSIGGISLISRDVSMLDYFKKNNPTRISENLMQEKLGGSQAVYVQFEGNIQSAAVLEKMKQCQDFMKLNPEIEQAQSVANLIEEMNEVMGEGKKIPDDDAKIQQLWFLLEGQDVMEQLVNPELTKGIIQARFLSSKYEKMKKFVTDMNGFIDQNSSESCKISLTGMPSVYVNMDRSLIRSQFSSILLAIVFVIIIVAGMLRSPKFGFLASLPIISTVLILFGFMGFVGIKLDLATVLVASVVIGIGIDYSIHVLTHYRHEILQLKEINAAVEDMILVSGRAILINVISVSAGLMVLLFSEMVPLQHFGLLIVLSMVFSGLGALTILPAILIISHKKINLNSSI